MSCVGLGSTRGSQLEVSTGHMSDGSPWSLVVTTHLRCLSRSWPRGWGGAPGRSPGWWGWPRWCRGTAPPYTATPLCSEEKRLLQWHQVIMRRLTHRLRDRQRTHRRGNSSSHWGKSSGNRMENWAACTGWWHAWASAILNIPCQMVVLKESTKPLTVV